MKNKMSYVMCQTSTSHTFGNVTAFIQNWLIKLFPENLFKTIHVHSKISHKQLRSTPKEFLKKIKPMFIIRPRIEWNSKDIFLADTPIMQRMGDLYHTYGGSNLQEFIYDRDRKLNVKYQMNRHVINFDVVLVFSTLMQQINYANYFLNVVRQEIPMTLQTYLESFIPEDMMKLMSECSGIPLYDDSGSVKRFLDYINSKSIFPITYKIQGSSGTNEFYRLYPVNIDTIITNFSVDEGERSGQISSNYQITFSIRCEFNSTGFYYIFSDYIDSIRKIVADDSATLVPIFTDVILKEDLNLMEGWSLYNSPSCMLDNNEFDTVNLSNSLNNSIKLLIKLYRDKGSPVDEFIDIRVRQQGKILRKNIDYNINWDTLDLNFIKCSTFYTYKILICINVSLINEMVKNIYEQK